MEWTEEDRKALLAFKDEVDCDDVKIKEQIKKVLLDNRFIVHVLNNKELEESDAEPEDYFGMDRNIRPAYIIPETQSSVKNFLCYEVGYRNLDRYNRLVKDLQITFYILCHEKDIIDEETGVARHDLLAALIQDQFNFTNYFGPEIMLVSDLPSVTDNSYNTRTLIFEQQTDNNVVKSRVINGKRTPMMANKEVHTLV